MESAFCLESAARVVWRGDSTGWVGVNGGMFQKMTVVFIIT